MRYYDILLHKMNNSHYLTQQIDSVRRRAREIFERSGHLVAIDPEGYQALRHELAQKSSQPTPDVLANFDQHLTPEDRCGLNIFFGVVNYCFVQPYTHVQYPYQSKSGRMVKRATGFYTALAESGVEWGQIEAIRQVTSDQWHAILQTDREADLFQLDARLERLKQFAAFAAGQGLHQSSELFAHYPDAGSILRLFIQSSLFEDPLLKRAQLTVYMLNPSARELTGQPIPGLEHFTVMADYRLPQLFYNHGALKILDADLLERLQDQQVIEPDSDYEEALRAATIVLGERLAMDLDLTESDLDHLLWELSQIWFNTGKMSIPQMLVPTEKY